MSGIVEQVSRYGLILIFTAGVFVSVLRPRPVVDTYASLGLPPRFPFVTAAVEALAVLLLLRSDLALWGALLAAATMGAAVLLTVRARVQAHHLLPPAATMLLSLSLAWQLH